MSAALVSRFFCIFLGACACLAAAAQPAEGDRETLIGHIRASLHPLAGESSDYDALMKLIGDARVVMLGESTHGSREFYRERARITRRLIEEKGFDAVVLEGDWPQLGRVDAYVRGKSRDSSAAEALSSIGRFPRWTWRNTDFRDFVEELRRHNASRPPGAASVSVYGMELYAVPEAARAVIGYLESVDPEAAQRARVRYRCMLRFEQVPEHYGRDLAARKIRSCRSHAERQFRELSRRVARSSRAPDEELFSAWQSARVVKNAEAYYRTLYGKGSSWNVRDRHMAETIDAVIKQHAFTERAGRIVVWAHNTHQGDARMTSQVAAGELNVGQLMRERLGERAILVGLSTYSGTVRAASEWGGADEVKTLLPASPESISGLMHGTGTPEFLLLLRGRSPALEDERPERVVGVLYLPDSERDSHYYSVRLSRQFDALVHIDATTALEPLE